MHIRLKLLIGQLNGDVIYIQPPKSARQCDAFKVQITAIVVKPQWN